MLTSLSASRPMETAPSWDALIQQECGIRAPDVRARCDLYLPAARQALELVFGERAEEVLNEAASAAVRGAAARSAALHCLDRRREIEPEWFLREHQIGYMAYADRFAGNLSGVLGQLDYLAELGVTYLHLMPLLKARDGESDGGYAVEDYGSVEPRLGTMADLETLAAEMHIREMSLCIDLVINHTADSHTWAEAARRGDPQFRDYFHVYADRTVPDQYEKTLTEVFPDFAPGNFTYIDGLGWVMTRFNSYQWDLNHANPAVFTAMFEVIAGLANRGVDVIRLDAAPFIWKELGTGCLNLPEAHALLQAWRALLRIAAPATLVKAEAIVEPSQLVQYLGAYDRERDETDIAYHNQLMVQLWSSMAARDTRLAQRSLARLRPAPPTTTWVTYIRNHDDIGWAIDDDDAAAVGWNGFAHRAFLASYFNGTFPGSCARGVDFQRNEMTGEARTSGTAAALLGLDQARKDGDGEALNAAVQRIVMMHSVMYSFGGIPVLFMGDELALANDDDYWTEAGHESDTRWLHRPVMDKEIAARRHLGSSVEAQVFGALAALGRARAAAAALRGGGATWLVDVSAFDLSEGRAASALLVYGRKHRRSGRLLAMANFADDAVELSEALLPAAGLRDSVLAYTSSPANERRDGRLFVQPRSAIWFTEP